MTRDKVKNYQYIYQDRVYEKHCYRTSAGNLPCCVCVFGDNKNNCHKPNDFNFSCGGFGYIKLIGKLEVQDEESK